MTSPLDQMIRDAVQPRGLDSRSVKGLQSLTLVRDRDGRFQCSYQKDRAATFSVHVANDPVEAIAGALCGLDGVRAVREAVEPEKPAVDWLEDLL